MSAPGAALLDWNRAALRPDDEERAELVGYLETLSLKELSAYCSGVLSAYALHGPAGIVEAVEEALPAATVVPFRPTAGRRRLRDDLRSAA